MDVNNKTYMYPIRCSYDIKKKILVLFFSLLSFLIFYIYFFIFCEKVYDSQIVKVNEYDFTNDDVHNFMNSKFFINTNDKGETDVVVDNVDNKDADTIESDQSTDVVEFFVDNNVDNVINIQNDCIEEETIESIVDVTKDDELYDDSVGDEVDEYEDFYEEEIVINPETSVSEESDVNAVSEIINQPDCRYQDGKTCVTVEIPSVGLYSRMTYGSTQNDVENYDVVFDTNGCNFTSDIQVAEIYGHCTRSLKVLHDVSVDDIIRLRFDDGRVYTYVVDYAEPGKVSNDLYFINSIYTGENLRYFYDGHLVLYTCWSYNNPTPNGSTDYRFVVGASLIIVDEP